MRYAGDWEEIVGRLGRWIGESPAPDDESLSDFA